MALLRNIWEKYLKNTGETPSKYLTRLRMNEAKRLLLDNQEMEIQKIGELVGYEKEWILFQQSLQILHRIQPSEFRNQK